MRVTGKKSSFIPESHNGPMTGSLVSWFQSELVSRSYMTLLLRYSIPDVPKVVGFPFILAEYTIPLPPQSVQ